VRLEGLDQLKNSSDLSGYQTRNLPACSIVPQPTTLPRVPGHCLGAFKFEEKEFFSHGSKSLDRFVIMPFVLYPGNP
jgi:hypothetical protein